MAAKRVSDSVVTSTSLMLPEHANPRGNVHGGVLMKFVDEVGGMCAMRHAQRPVVTVAIDSMRFLSPVHVGDLVTFRGQVDYVGRTSMEVSVVVEAENPVTLTRTHTNSAYLVYVALDEQGKPVPAPSLDLQTEEEIRNFEQAKIRQRERLARDGRAT